MRVAAGVVGTCAAGVVGTFAAGVVGTFAAGVFETEAEDDCETCPARRFRNAASASTVPFDCPVTDNRVAVQSSGASAPIGTAIGV